LNELENIIDIIKGCIDGDHKYQRIFYDRYRGFALKTVFRYIYSYEGARDVMNDGFVKLFSHFASFKCDEIQDIEKILMGWIRRVMINTAIDELRKGKMLPETGVIPDYIWDIPDNRQADQMILYKDLILFLKRLPPQYRIVFNMNVIDGFNHNEIANTLGISVGTSKSSLSRARDLLRKFIKEEDKITAWSL
jgi:RNA polymerase sigma-70 factor (ECF subfamily)